MNLQIKHRESCWIFVPAVMEYHVWEYYCIDRASPYMLLMDYVRSNKYCQMNEEEQDWLSFDKLDVVRSSIPALAHMDFSVRLQIVELEDNPLYCNNIDAFRKKIGCPVIINNNFNLQSEPIVCILEQAYALFMPTEMDY